MDNVNQRFLLAHGANPLAADANGNTVLDHAYEPMARDARLMKEEDAFRGRKIGFGSARGSSRLSEKRAFVQELRGHGAHLSLVDAAQFGEMADVKFALAKGADVNVVSRENSTALIEAATNDHAEVVALLLQHGANVDARDHSGWTALMKAASVGSVRVVRMLLEHKANPMLHDDLGKSALGIARARHRMDVAAILERATSTGKSASGGEQRRK